MKRIILFLALLSLGVSKAQVVGGYLPLNSTKSATMGGLRVNGTTITTSLGVNTTYTNSLTNFNLIHGTSTISMGSQSSGNPALWLGGGADATNYSLAKSGSNLMLNTGGANLYFQTGGGGNRGTWNSTGLRIGSGSNPTAVLDVTGDAKVSTTFSLGSANLTGGNTGTVAVLSDALFTTTHFHGLATTGTITYFYDTYPSSSGVGGSSGTVGRTVIPFNCKLVGYGMSTSVLGTLGSAGNATISVRINNTTDVTLTSVAQYSASASTYSANNLSTSITAGDIIEIKVVPNTTPTAATNVIQKVVLFYSRN